jgi:APA family basic amino acid/polyamine antiporter
MLNLPAETWWRFIVWMAVGFGVYFLYSFRNSRLRTDPNVAYADENGQAVGAHGAGAQQVR